MRLLRPGWLAVLFLVVGGLTIHLAPWAPFHAALREKAADLAAHSFPPVPDALAPGVPGDRVRLSLLSSPRYVEQVRAMVDPRAVALDAGDALARMDGRVFASDAASVRALLDRLGWQRLAVDIEKSDPQTALALAADRAPFTAARRAHFAVFTGLQSLRDLANEHVLLALALLSGLAAFAAWRLAALTRTAWRRSVRARRVPRPEESEWTAPAGMPEVKVVLVATRSALEAVRTAIGEEHVLAATPDAFAFAHGWILAVRENTVWQLVSELGWGDRRLRLWESGDPAGNAEAVIRGAARATTDGSGPLTVIDALHLVGPIAHSEGAI